MKSQLTFIFFAAFISTLVHAQRSCSEHKVEIVCDSIDTSSLSIVGYITKCDGATTITSTIPGSSVSKVVHINGAYVTNLLDIEALEINGAMVSFIPFGLKRSFKYLRAIRIVSSGLKNVKKENLKEFGDSLALLDLSKNILVHIDGDLFEYNHKLQGINLAGNPIKDIGLEFFTNLKNLKQIQLVDLSSTDCINIVKKGVEISTSEWDRSCVDEISRALDRRYVEEALCFEAKSSRSTAKILETVQKIVSTSAKFENSMKKSNDELKTMIDVNSKRLSEMEKKLESILGLINQLSEKAHKN